MHFVHLFVSATCQKRERESEVKDASTCLTLIWNQGRCFTLSTIVSPIPYYPCHFLNSLYLYYFFFLVVCLFCLFVCLFVCSWRGCIFIAVCLGVCVSVCLSISEHKFEPNGCTNLDTVFAKWLLTALARTLLK